MCICMDTPRQISVFLFIDALGWDLVEPRAYLADILPYRKSAEMQFGYSCTAIPTILSGKRPAEHGHLGLFRFAPKDSPFRAVAAFMRCLKPASFWRRGRVRNQLSKLVKKLLGFTGYFQLYAVPPEKLGYMDYGEKKNLFVPGGLERVENLADRCERSGVR